MKHIRDALHEARGLKSIPTASAVLGDGSLLEMVCRPQERNTQFVVWRDGAWSLKNKIKVDFSRELVPYAYTNNLIQHNVVLFPSEPAEYDSDAALLTEIQAFIHRYVDVSALFERIASYYVLLSWVYDGFNELPYLRVRGDPGTGKTRCLLTIGTLCYKPIFAGGASTVSPIFRILEAFQGTLIIDESDFRFSDEKAEIVKILNNGNVRGFPVLRSEATGTGEFNPKAYQVFGPKLVATRGAFDDRALESRFLTEEMGNARLRDEVPINLPASHKQEAQQIRNKLLLFRFRRFRKQQLGETLIDRTIEPRLNQIFAPLLSMVDDPDARAEFRNMIKQYHRDLVVERGMDAEAQILEIIRSLLAAPGVTKLSIDDIKGRFVDLYGGEYDGKITHRWVGGIVRKRLGLKTQKSHGVYVVPVSELEKLPRLYEKYGVEAPMSCGPGEVAAREAGDLGDIGEIGTIAEGNDAIQSKP
jgi:hypothetical protein